MKTQQQSKRSTIWSQMMPYWCLVISRSGDKAREVGREDRDPHVRTRCQASLSSRGVTREQSKETHLSSLTLVVGGSWREGENPHPHSSLRSRIKALPPLKTRGTKGAQGQQEVVNFPNALKISESSVGAKKPQTTGKVTKSRKTQTYQDLCRREATGHLTDGSRRTPTPSAGPTGEQSRPARASARSSRNLCTLNPQVSMESRVGSQWSGAVWALRVLETNQAKLLSAHEKCWK